MHDLRGRLAVVTGGGTGIGRALVRQLVEHGCHVATCDIRPNALEETLRLAKAASTDGARATTFVTDVADEAGLAEFRKDTAERHGTDHVHLLFNNAGVGGGGSFVTSARGEWERTFDVCWRGVYLTTRVFLPSLIRAPRARLVNVSSVNGFWASLGPETPHTAYSAAKFAVKGFTEALITDLRINAPHVGVSLVMPGHVGTMIVHNTVAEFRSELDEAEAEQLRRRSETFQQKGLSPEEAATIILEGVRAGAWRILVGRDAYALDTAVRAAPEQAYEVDFYRRLPSVDRD